MRVEQIVLEGATHYERKCQRIDARWLAARGELAVAGERADLVHVYGPDPLPAAAVAAIRAPYVANAAPARPRMWLARLRQPLRVVTPLRDGETYVPEAVEDEYFTSDWSPPREAPLRIGSVRRRAVLPFVDQTRVRISRFRDDVEWTLFDGVPSPPDLATLSLWVDPAVDERDYDGGVAEALAGGLPVVASRTPLNQQRLDKGQSGLLPPAGDFNEMSHAILAALFKPEVRDVKRTAARQTLSKFRRQSRARALERMYQDLVG